MAQKDTNRFGQWVHNKGSVKKMVDGIQQEEDIAKALNVSVHKSILISIVEIHSCRTVTSQICKLYKHQSQ